MDLPKTRQPWSLRLCRIWLGWLAARIPDHRAERFLKEWEAELAYTWQRLGSRGRDDPGARLRLFCRVFFAWRDAWHLRRTHLTSGRKRNDLLSESTMDDFLLDLRFAFRGLRKAPGFTAVALLTLALGLGASTSIYSVVRGIVWQPLPYPEPDRILAFEPRSSFSKEELRRYQAELSSFQSIAAWVEGGAKLLAEGGAQYVQGPEVSGEFFDVLGISPARGRLLRVGDDRRGGDGLVVSATFWRQLRGQSEGVVGQRLPFAGGERVVVGTLPDGMPVLQRGARLVTPLLMEEDEQWTGHYLSLVGRLRPGVSTRSAQAELGALLDRQREQNGYPADWGRSVALIPLQDHLVGPVRTRLLLLLGAVLLTLLIATVNVTHLLLARSLERQSEMSLRSALGASSGRLVRQLMTEATLLATLGGILGYLFAHAGVRGLIALLPADTPRLEEVTVDLWSLGFALGVSGITGWLVGLAPALKSARFDLRTALAAGSRGGQTAGRKRLRAGLVVAEVALAVALLSAAGVLVTSFERLRSVPPGFVPTGLLTATVAPEKQRFSTTEELETYYGELEDRLAALPGVESVTSVHAVPIHETGWRMGIYRADRPAPKDRMAPLALWRPVGNEWMATGGLTMLAGRRFSAMDRAESRPVAILNETAARELFPEGYAVGQSLFMSWVSKEPLEVVGIVGDVKATGLGLAAPRMVYRPFSQSLAKLLDIGFVQRSLTMRVAGDPAVLASAVRQTVSDHDPEAAVLFLQSMDSVIAESLASEQAVSLLLTLFAVSALMLGAVGLYGVMESSVKEQRKELSIRLALGASSRQLFRRVLLHGLGLGALGSVFGLALALALGRTLETLVFEIQPGDPKILAAVLGVLFLVAAVATGVPAWRAGRADPIVALRSE